MMQIYNLNNYIDAPIGLVATETSIKTINLLKVSFFGLQLFKFRLSG